MAQPAPAPSVIVRPVIDLAGHQHVDSYEIPDRIRRHVTLRDHHCAYPYCTRPAESGDIDHIQPYADGGPTCTHNLAAPCRGHHRMKTAGHATYRMLHPGTYLLDPARPGPTWSTPPAPTTSPAHHWPTRPRSSYQAPNPANGGAIGMPRVSRRSQSDLLDQRAVPRPTAATTASTSDNASPAQG